MIDAGVCTERALRRGVGGLAGSTLDGGNGRNCRGRGCGEREPWSVI